MKAIGFRIEPKTMHWAVVEGPQDEPVIVAKDSVSAPKANNEAEGLSWYRNRAMKLFAQYQPQVVAVRYAEPFARSGKTDPIRARARIEGVVIEAACTSGMKVLCGALKVLSSRLGTKSAKKYVDAGEFRGLDLTEIHIALREAILAGVAALE